MTAKVKVNAGIFVVIFVVFCLFFIGKGGLYILSGLRAYVNAEALWSKGQKESTYQLIQYLFTEEESRYQSFIDSLKVPLGDKRARLELQKTRPVDSIAFDGFADGGNDPEDIPKLIFLFKHLQGVGHIREAIKQWRIADSHIVRLLEIGKEVHDLIVNHRMNVEHSARILSSIDAVQNEVASAEVLFSDNISKATRWFSNIISTTMIFFTIIGSIVCLVIIRLIAGIGNKLIDSEQRYRRLTENSPDMIYRMSLPDGKYEYVSPAVENIFGYSPKDFYENPAFIRNTMHPDWQSYFMDQWSLLISGEAPPYYEYQIIDRFGETRWIHQRNVIIKSDVGTTIAIEGIVTDITFTKQAVEERLKLESHLLQSQKMEAVGTLAGGIAHDFNNILAAILGYTELTLTDNKLTPKNRENLDQVLTAANRAKELVKQILMFSRKGEEKREPIHIHLIVEEAAKLLRQTIPTTVKINLDVDHHTGSVLADATQMHQILMNFGTNAYHAMRETGGELDIRLEPVQVDQATASKYPDLREGSFALLTVKDTGSGMDPITLSRIFDPFFTTKRVGEGTGMGLSVVHGIIQSHGGAIGVESCPGAGTTFEVFLPLTEGEEAKTIAAADTSPTGDEHILLVDDEPALAKMLGKMLEALGYRISVAASSREALATFHAAPEAFDLMLTDETMPEMTGDQLAREVMKLRPGFPVIICTGYSDIIDDTKARAMGIRALLMKPVNRNQLAETLRRVLDEAV